MAIVITIIVAGLIRYEFSRKAPKDAPLPLFQPEEQMLGNAINPKQDIGVTTDVNANEILAATASGTSYTYDPNICSASETTSTDPYICFANYYKSLTKTYGVGVAVADIKQRYNESSEIFTNCHPYMHIIGQVASAFYPTVSEAYLHGDSFCWSGYYHGVLEGVVFRIGLQKLPAEINNICADIPGKASYNFNYYNCVHGLGHGIMEVLGDDVFKSLATCDYLVGDWEQNSCYGGVFMENIIIFDHDGTSDFLKKSDPLYPCDAVNDRYKSACYLGQTSFALEISNYDFKSLFPLCAGLQEPYRDICNQSTGRDAANQAYHQAERTEATCWLAAVPNDRANCVIGAVKEIISYYHSDIQAKEFCSILDDANKSICASTADEYYRLL